MERLSKKNLSNKQLAALPYLVSHRSLSQAARLADVGRTPIYQVS